MVSLTAYVCLLSVVCSSIEGSELNRQKRKACSALNICNFGEHCHNGGTCRRNETTCYIYCVCQPGYTGDKCETVVEVETSTVADNTTDCTVDQCLTSNPCSNGGTCSWKKTTCKASCTCPNGYSGDTCEETENFNPFNPVNGSCPFNYCDGENPCLNGATCVQNSDCNLLCDCPPSHTGELCEHLITTPEDTGSPVETQTQPTLKNCGGGYMCLYGECYTGDEGDTTCKCDKNHTGTFCHIDCFRNCTEHGICDRLSASAPETCNCIYPYTGDYCEKELQFDTVKAGTDDWKFWVVGSCVVLLVLLGLLVLVAYILLRRRNIFIMQVLYFFQPYEDDDGKQFDAFVSYKSSPEDENFVYRTLYPELEKERGFKLCLHQRDFHVGETIANNIIWAIENSRRTILVLSPRYMESDFTRFEYQIAHDEMLKQKHKVIPLLLEDISQQKNQMDNTLISIIKSITYIEWPKETETEALKKFWKRMELSLPKRKVSIESDTPEADLDTACENAAFSDMPVELEMISVQNGDGSISKSKSELSYSERISNDVICEPEKEDTEKDVTAKPMNKQELKSFFDQPVDDEVFNKMREKAFVYEQCLDV